MKVLLVDDHPLLREGVAILLKRLDSAIDAVEAGTCAEAVQRVAEHPDFDLALLDLGLPDQPGYAAIAAIKATCPELPIVVLSSNDDRESVLKALDTGAMGFIPKSSTSDVLIAALKLVLSKGVYLPASVLLGGQLKSQVGSGEVQQGVRQTRPADLGITERQADVLHLIVQGHSAKAIGKQLDLAPSTVKTHTSAVLRALNVTTRTQAIVAAGRIGLVFN